MAPEAASRQQRLRALERRQFHGHGFEAPLEMLKQHLDSAIRIELFPEERVAFLDIPFGELFHRCTSEEWTEFAEFLSGRGITPEETHWWQFWRR